MEKDFRTYKTNSSIICLHYYTDRKDIEIDFKDKKKIVCSGQLDRVHPIMCFLCGSFIGQYQRR